MLKREKSGAAKISVSIPKEIVDWLEPKVSTAQGGTRHGALARIIQEALRRMMKEETGHKPVTEEGIEAIIRRFLGDVDSTDEADVAPNPPLSYETPTELVKGRLARPEFELSLLPKVHHGAPKPLTKDRLERIMYFANDPTFEAYEAMAQKMNFATRNLREWLLWYGHRRGRPPK